jgi:hypothetical protein
MTKKRKPTRPLKRQTARDTRLHVANTLGLDYLRERIHAVFQPVITAALESAIGLRHMFEKDPTTGQWARVTDPDAIAARLNEHGPRYDVTDRRIVLYEQDPDERLLEGLLTFMLGAPFDATLYPQLVERVEMDAETGKVTVHVNEAFLATVRRPRAGERPRRRGPSSPSTARPIH